MASFFHTIIFEPLYNGLVFLIHITPFADVGIAVIIFTCIVKLLLFPLSKKAVKTQMAMKAIEPETEKIKNQFKNNREELARQTMALYKKHQVNPFSSFAVILIQIPIILGLYYVFFKGGLPTINTDWLYSFVAAPDKVNMIFLGLLDISKKSIFLALLAGVSQFFQAKLAMPPIKPRGAEPDFKADLARSMGLQMRYIFPIVVVFIAYSISGAIALYWTTSNIFAIGQELIIRRQLKTGQQKL
ncbi:MAG: Preprotein translocase subunit YidC [Parcubacteria group bacterium GW2011_GWB1_44_7]|nr:MAG: Preprotein translocase subunit YidC [Parcubacteria group bacterium GW2011_GWB1_44_7]